jgi:hypothetical protein
MSTTSEALKKGIEEKLNNMRAMRDELRVQVHLGGLDAKAQWNKLEPQLAALDHIADEVSDATDAAVTKVLKSLADLKASMHV